MKALDTTFARGFIRVYDDGFNQNWRGRNGGNLSYCIEPEGVESVEEEPSYNGKWQSAGANTPTLSGEYFIVSGSGRFMRSVILGPETNCCIVEVDQTGENYRIYWEFVKGGRLTSELLTHLMNYEVKIRATEGRCRVIYHTHPVNIIALTFVLLLTDEVFIREPWEMTTGCPVVSPADVSMMGWMMPGGRDITVTTSRLMGKYGTTVWTRHGLSCADEDFDLTFSLIYTIKKSVEILIKVLSIRPDKPQTITPQELRSPTMDFRVNPSEKLLYKKWTESGRLEGWH